MDRDSRILARQLACNARRQRPAWITEFSRATGHEARAEDFLSVEETAALRNRIVGKLRLGEGVMRLEFQTAHLQQLYISLEREAKDQDRGRVVLFNHEDSYLGAVNVPLQAVFRHAQAVWNLVKNDLSFARLDLTSGFCLELNHYDLSGNYFREGIYLLSLWGELAELTVESIPQNALFGTGSK